MSRYIDADALLKSIGHIPEGVISDYDAGRWDVTQLVKEAPTADVVEVRHGKWVSHIVGEAGSFDIYAHYCNECDFVYESGSEYGCKYCPNCGAKMDGGREQ